ncbi:conserved virulence factor C family protein [Paenibacillus sp.]|uniref:conserved virulence factor C family protein n=1 Tax=Paenibacillus sp. TaxID=58172 RepID=UPI002D5BA4B8|nr:conserved virulence factor C family protein [Paenibacillus sp.]HZG86910.1 conserved virulence factor C family protein [Paenibacillus sp.]
MNLVRIEPTPSPNAMKLNVDESLAPGVKYAFDAANAGRAPAHLRALLVIPGVKSVYQAADFIAVEREPAADWRAILAAVREAFGGTGTGGAAAEGGDFSYGEATVLVQMFRGIPMQVRVRAGHEESRVALPQRFADAAMTAGAASPNLIRERRLVEHGVRYGELADIVAEVAAELDAAYDDARLAQLIAQAEAMGAEPDAAPPAPEPAAEALTPEQLAARLRDADWKVRYAALERLQPSEETLPLLDQALADDNFSVRRLAVVYLGDIKGPEAVRRLTAMLKDPSAAVRRTAGDALSDIGDASAQPAMIESLADKSKIVRWRAARFLYDLGDEAAIPALRIAAEDPEFEVALQARMALERIESGEAAAGTVWQQMARSRETE